MSSTIDLDEVLNVLEGATRSASHLNGRPLDERDSATAPKSTARHERAALSRELQFLSHQLELAAALATAAYWSARGYESERSVA